MGFEPMKGLILYTLSKRAPSTTRPPLQKIIMKFDFALILTCTIQPSNMPNLIRSDTNLRLQDYKKSFNFWADHPKISKIIFIENTNYDITYFKN